MNPLLLSKRDPIGEVEHEPLSPARMHAPSAVMASERTDRLPGPYALAHRQLAPLVEFAAQSHTVFANPPTALRSPPTVRQDLSSQTRKREPRC